MYVHTFSHLNKIPLSNLLAIQMTFESVAFLKTLTNSFGPLQFQMAVLASASPKANMWRQSMFIVRNFGSFQVNNGTIFWIPPAIRMANLVPSYKRNWNIIYFEMLLLMRYICELMSRRLEMDLLITTKKITFSSVGIRYSRWGNR